jgi:hypothetical protein
MRGKPLLAKPKKRDCLYYFSKNRTVPM